MVKWQLFGLGPKIILTLAFIAIFIIMAALLTPQIREGIFYYLVNSLSAIYNILGGGI